MKTIIDKYMNRSKSDAFLKGFLRVYDISSENKIDVDKIKLSSYTDSFRRVGNSLSKLTLAEGKKYDRR